MGPYRPSRRALLAGGLATAAAGALRPVAGAAQAASGATALQRAVARHAEPLPEIDDEAFGALFDRFADAKVVLLGEATHGTSEFYRARAAITRRLITRHGFRIVAVEADWPDAAHVDAYIRGRDKPAAPQKPFRRFPTWMWRNEEMRAFLETLKAHNAAISDPAAKVGFHGLDLYSTGASLQAVLAYAERMEPGAAARLRDAASCLAGYADDPSDYAAALLRPGFKTCREDVGALVKVLSETRPAAGDGEAHFDALRNARVVAGSEHYYRSQVEGTESSWNLRDRHMFDTLLALLEARGAGAKAVVWAHNSHVGNAAATEMGDRGEFNIGELCRRHFKEAARLVGFGTDRGTVMAASGWDAPPEIKVVRPSLPESYGALFREAGPERFLLDLRRPELREALKEKRLERAIGVVYMPETERWSHYFDAALPEQFDAFMFMAETKAVTPVTATTAGLPAGHPFAE